MALNKKIKQVSRMALVTGGSRGIGKAISLTLAKEGISIAIAYLRDDQAAEQTAREIRRLGVDAWLYRMDLRSPEEIKAMFHKITERYNRLDFLIHAAALGVFKPMIELSPLQLSRVFDINVRSFVLSAQESSKLMNSGGSIIAVSSLGGQRYITKYGAMGIAKASLEAAVRYLAVELAPRNIRVNAVSGGPVDTLGVRKFPDYKKGKRESAKLTPAGRIGTPKDIANVVNFLCDDKSAWIQGQTLIADGGLSLRVASL